MVLKKIERGLQRLFAAIVGVVLGVIAGLALALFAAPALNLFWALVGGAGTGLVASLAWPSPFLFLGELLLSMLGIDL